MCLVSDYLYVSPIAAIGFGATHHARIFGFLPGYFSPDDGLWISKYPPLAWVEVAAAHIWAMMCKMRGNEPDFMFSVGSALSVKGAT
jgi:hypothetical protein